MSSLSRHESRLRRTVERATRQLLELQAARKQAETEILQNEPGDEQTCSLNTDDKPGKTTGGAAIPPNCIDITRRIDPWNGGNMKTEPRPQGAVILDVEEAS